MTTKLRSAGLPVESLPGPPLLPPGLTPLELSQRGRALAKASVLGVRQGPSRRDPETVELLFDTVRRQVNPNHGLRRPTTFQWEFTDPDIADLAPAVENGSSSVTEGAAPKPDLRLRLSCQDWVDIVGQRLHPLRRFARGRAAAAGKPACAAQAYKGFSAGLMKPGETAG